jgi:N-acetylmuramoyl-L-alanine amidase
MQTKFNPLVLLGGATLALSSPVYAQDSFQVVYPPPNHETTASQIFFIGTAPPSGEVVINGQTVQRSPAGHFAPSLPLEFGENQFQIRYNNQTIPITVTRISSVPTLSQGMLFNSDSLTPSRDIARLPGERLCFNGLAVPDASVAVELGKQTISLTSQESVALPPNSAVLTFDNEPITTITEYQGCATLDQPGNYGQPVFKIQAQGQTVTQPTSASVSVLSPDRLQTVEVTETEGVARTGPSTSYSRLTPLPQGTQARVTGSEGEWLRLDYGGWINQEEVRVINKSLPVNAVIRSIQSREVPGMTEVVFPLEYPVPLSIRQDDQELILTLYNLVAQTDTIYTQQSPVVGRLDWRQLQPDEVEYTFQLKTPQQWGYDFRYEGSNLILSIHHPPNVQPGQPLDGVEILLDPGHGGEELGARGPTGLPEKAVNLTVSQLLQQELLARGATVYMTRETDTAVSLRGRMDEIDEINPDLALSIHYNALPDAGDAKNTAGIGAFWYHTQAYSLAEFLHDYLVNTLDRPSYGVFWNNLALTRPHSAPTVLLELGFMINPEEFEWITDPQAQEQLAIAIANGIVEWVQQQTTSSPIQSRQSKQEE